MVLGTNHPSIITNNYREFLARDEDCLDVVVSWIEKELGKSYFVTPLEKFLSTYGKVNPEDLFYQARMNYFLEICVHENPFPNSNLAPIAVFFQNNRQLIASSSPTKDHWQQYCGSHHSLFQVVKPGNQMCLLHDLIFDRPIKIVSKAGETLKYLRAKSIFQGFIFGGPNDFKLGQGQINHPDHAFNVIHKFIKQYRRAPGVTPKQLLATFASVNMRYLRMQHVNPAVIYQDIFNLLQEKKINQAH